MFKVDNGHINPQHVSYIQNIVEGNGKESDQKQGHYSSCLNEITEGQFAYHITLTSGDQVTSEEFATYEEAVKNRGILVRMVNPSLARPRDKQKQRLQEEK